MLGVVLALLADSFIKTMNGRSTEVSNYSVIVQGLPDDATHAEVGRIGADDEMSGPCLPSQRLHAGWMATACCQQVHDRACW